MSAYLVFMREQTFDQNELDKYAAQVDASFNQHNFKLLVDYGAIETLEGEEIEGAVILEFPSISSAKAWYQSFEYQSAAKHRFDGARYRGFVVAGV